MTTEQAELTGPHDYETHLSTDVRTNTGRVWKLEVVTFGKPDEVIADRIKEWEAVLPGTESPPEAQSQRAPAAPQSFSSGENGPACPEHPQSKWGMKESKFPEWDYYCTAKDSRGPKGYCVLKQKDGEFYVAPNVKWSDDVEF